MSDRNARNDAAPRVRDRTDVAAALRRRILRYAAGQAIHLGSSLSVVDILHTLGCRAGLGPATAGNRTRDRLVLSKGHAVWALYAVLAELGLLTADPPPRLPGHPPEGLPGIDVSTGALGHGLSIGAGLCESARLAGSDRRTYVVLGDGELNEGSVWEAAMYAAHRGLDRLTAVVDLNGMQQEGPTSAVLDLAPLDEKWRAFGWNVRTADGHDPVSLTAALDRAESQAGRPSVVLATTVKGKGIPFMEHSSAWHVGVLDAAQLAEALAAVDSTGGSDVGGGHD
ncbi:transketolase [Actinoplanes sp. LDG1-06]|uniref:Transketolase n=1 Tax=Paractinoplanes ovalisporus TaxID=2810368 RepID=A0ABS2ALX6_9ACTN|nr:transketolase [Actinoplanes ovalisporus]MBM2620378.1 transketolase [Actinoplanes ovalisporus]